MISTNSGGYIFPILLEQNRPNVFNEKDRIWWLSFHNLIKESSIEIQINGAFWGLDDGLQIEGVIYCGGHFRYNFGFKTREDKQAFLDELKLLRGE
jgi:hypothetical protein